MRLKLSWVKCGEFKLSSNRDGTNWARLDWVKLELG